MSKYIIIAILSVALLSALLGALHAFGETFNATDDRTGQNVTIAPGTHLLNDEIIKLPDFPTFGPCSAALSDSACNQLNNVIEDEYQLYEQQEEIIKQNNQIIKADAYNYCKGIPTAAVFQIMNTTNPSTYIDNSINPFQDCVKQFISDTK